jgi:tetratricopeptide (TPR) repeat protein
MDKASKSVLKFLKESITLHLVFVALIALLAYSNTLDVPFHFDDKPNIVKNPVIKDLRFFLHPSETRKFASSEKYSAFRRRHVGYLSFALNYRVHGLSVRGYHAVNLAIHVLNGLLVYLLIVLTFRSPKLKGSALMDNSSLIALFTALLFVCHPVQTQAVTYIVQRFASMATMFYLLSVVLYAGSRLMAGRVARYSLYVLSLVSAVLAMKTKETAFTLPVAVALYEFMFFSGKAKRRLLHLTPLLLTMLIIPMTLIDVDRPLREIIGDAGEKTIITDMPRLDYLLTEFRVIVTYLRLLAFPTNQNLDYDYSVYHSFFEPPVFLSFVFLLGVFGLGIYFYSRSRIADNALRLGAFGIFWFFISLSVESSIIPLRVIYEHRLYLPSMGIFAVFGTVVFLLFEMLRGKAVRAVLIALIVVVLMIFSTASYTRNSVWRSEISLWEDVVSKFPEDARAHNNLGKAYWSKGLFDKAIEHYQSALRLVPNNVDMYSNIGVAYWSKGLFDKAIEHYRSALRLVPNSEVVHNNLGIAYASRGLFDKAIEHYQTALRLNPYLEETHNNLGNAYRSKGLIDKAIEHYLFALRLRPDSAEAHVNLANAYMSKGLPDKAIEHYGSALRLKPDYADAHYNLGLVYFKGGLLEKARREFKSALRIEPGYQKARQYLDMTNRIQPR